MLSGGKGTEEGEERRKYNVGSRSNGGCVSRFIRVILLLITWGFCSGHDWPSEDLEHLKSPFDTVEPSCAQVQAWPTNYNFTDELVRASTITHLLDESCVRSCQQALLVCDFCCGGAASGDPPDQHQFDDCGGAAPAKKAGMHHSRNDIRCMGGERKSGEK